LIIIVEALHQTVSRTKKYEDNELLLNLVGTVAGLEYELEQAQLYALLLYIY